MNGQLFVTVGLIKIEKEERKKKKIRYKTLVHKFNGLFF
jgi:hypothetical protein